MPFVLKVVDVWNNELTGANATAGEGRGRQCFKEEVAPTHQMVYFSNYIGDVTQIPSISGALHVVFRGKLFNLPVLGK